MEPSPCLASLREATYQQNSFVTQPITQPFINTIVPLTQSWIPAAPEVGEKFKSRHNNDVMNQSLIQELTDFIVQNCMYKL